MHVRQQIREAIVTALTGSVTGVGARVFDSPVDPLSTLPAIAVFTPETEHDYSSGQMQCAPLHGVGVLIEGYVKANTSYQGALDDIAEQVETLIYSDTGIAAITKHIELGSQPIGLSGEGEKIAGNISINFVFYYYAQEGAPGSIY